jgi:methyl-accepting chemotaxis protein
MQDADWKYVIKGLIDTVKKGGGWFEYKWSHPQTKKIDDKAAYVQKADDNVWIGCGVYR